MKSAELTERVVLSAFVVGLAAVGAWIVYIILHNAFLSVEKAITIADRMAG